MYGHVGVITETIYRPGFVALGKVVCVVVCVWVCVYVSAAHTSIKELFFFCRAYIYVGDW